MALSVAATFVSLVEAQIACSALTAAGFDAQVFDQNTAFVADRISGFRLMVPEDDGPAARSFLADLQRANDG